MAMADIAEVKKNEHNLASVIDTVAWSKLKFDEKTSWSGAYGIVRKVIHNDSGLHLAYKEPKKQRIDFQKSRAEEEIQRQLRHPNIVSLFGVVADDKHYGLLLEFAEYGSLDKFPGTFKHKTGEPLSWKLKVQMVTEVCLGMCYLHTLQPKPLIHRDLKTGNVVLTDRLTAKITDFGLSKWKGFVPEKEVLDGSPQLRPPEYWQNPKRPASEKFDIYGFSILLWELFTEEWAFFACKEYIRPIVQIGTRLPLDNIPANIIAIISTCWKQDPDTRPMFTELLPKLTSFAEIEMDLVRVVLEVYNRPVKTPSKSDHCLKMERASAKLSQLMRRTDRILNHLHDKRQLTQEESDRLRSLSVAEFTTQLVKILGKLPVTAYKYFLDALKATSQHHLCQLLEDGDIILTHRDEMLMKEQYYRSTLQGMLSRTTLLADLLKEAVLDEQEVDEIRSKSTEDQRIEELLYKMNRTSQQQYELFQKSLGSAETISTTVIPSTASSRINVDPKTMRKLRDVTDILECQYGLLEDLHSRKVLTLKQVTEVNEKKSLDQNDKLVKFVIEYMYHHPSYDNFIAALRSTGQGHLANYITGDVDSLPYNEKLGKSERATLKSNEPFLKECIDLEKTNLLSLLLENDVITKKHVSHIENQKDKFKKNKALLEIIRCRSIAQYKRFLVCLHKIHPKIAAVLKTGGVATAVDMETDKNLEIQQNIKMLAEKPEEVRLAFIHQLGSSLPPNLEFVDIKDGHSFRLFILCQLLESLCMLRHIVESGELKSILEYQLSLLLPSHQCNILHLYLIDYCQCKDYFISQYEDDADAQRVLYYSERKVSPLPQEPWEPALLKSFITLYDTIMITREANIRRAVYETIASVSLVHWKALSQSAMALRPLVQHQTLTTAWFSKLLDLHNFLVNNLECQFGLLDELCGKHVLSDQQRTEIAYDSQLVQDRSDDNKNVKLLSSMKHITMLQQFENFLAALRSNNQDHVVLYIACRGMVDTSGDDRPLTDDELCRLEINLTYLCDHISVDTIIIELHTFGCISEAHKNYLLNRVTTKEPGPDLQKELLRIMQRRCLRSFTHFMNYRHRPETLALISPGQELKNEANFYRDILPRQSEYLEAHLNSYKSGLASDLLKKKLISTEQFDAIAAEDNETMRTRALMGIISQKSDYDDYEEFLVSLWKTDQAHLTRYIIRNGTGPVKQLIQTSTGRPVSGVAQLPGYIFVSHIGSNVLFVYESSLLHRLPSITLKTSREEDLNITDIIASTIPHCLYIYHDVNTVVMRVQVTEDDRRGLAEEWLLLLGRDCSRTLSVTSEGQLMVAIRTPLPSTIEFYDPDDNTQDFASRKPAHVIKLPSDVGIPYHVVETPSHDFIVLPEHDNGSSLCQLFMVNHDGEIIRSWSKKLDRALWGGHLAVDSEGRVYLADNGQLLMFDSTLSKISFVLRQDDESDGQRFNPRRLCYLRENERLVLGHQFAHLDIFSVT